MSGETPERRTYLRHHVLTQVRCEPRFGGVTAGWPANLLDISHSGARIGCDRQVFVGEEFVMRWGSAARPSYALAIVTWVEAKPRGGHLVGCEFLGELSRAQLASLPEAVHGPA